jgi:cell wall-associated NlpC family hydrolase
MIPARLLAVVAVPAVAILLVLGLTVVGAVGQDSTSASLLTVSELASQTCPVTGSISTLAADQSANADAVVAAAMAASDENLQAVQIALMTAITESQLHNLDHGDLDSLGLFQQRPSQGWGTAAQLMDPTYATDTFVRQLLAVPGWQKMAPGLAAQAVQHSGTADGSNYQANWNQAGIVALEVLGNAGAPGGCGQGVGSIVGPPSAHGLPADYALPAGTAPDHAKAVQFALAQLGKPYVWGAAGPDAFDCSGLTMAAWASAHIPLLHYTGDQQNEGTAVTEAQLVPGDMILTPGSDQPAPGVAGHVGLYLGDNLVVSAIDPQDGIAVQTWDTFVSGGLVGLRDPAPGE